MVVRVLQGNQPLGSMPHYGGTDDHGATAFRVVGEGPIPTPRELVAKLDDYVIGQDAAKRARLLTHLSDLLDIECLRPVFHLPVLDFAAQGTLLNHSCVCSRQADHGG